MNGTLVYCLAIVATHPGLSTFGAPDREKTLRESKHLLTHSRPRFLPRRDEPTTFGLQYVGLRYDLSPARTRLGYGRPLYIRPPQ
jgi:hypothetical protein